MTEKELGFVGLGIMGKPMARKPAKGRLLADSVRRHRHQRGGAGDGRCSGGILFEGGGRAGPG